MSNLWLVFALAGTFTAVFLVGVFVEMSMRERHRPVALLQSQVGQVTDSVDMRSQELSGNFLERALMPAARRAGRGLVRLTPFDLHSKINDKLVLAGNPPGWDAERVVGLKIVGAVAGLVGGILLATLLPIGGLVRILFVAVFVVIGYTIPSAQVSSKASARQKQIQRQLSDVMDLLTISVEAGLGFDAAMAQVVHNVPGPLAQELTRLLQEVQIGVSRADAFRHLAERTNVPELQAFVLSRTCCARSRASCVRSGASVRRRQPRRSRSNSSSR